MKTILIVLSACFIGMSNPFSESTELIIRDCSAILNVEKDRTFKSADESGASFLLFLENTSSSEATYILNAENVSKSCSPGNRSSQENVNLNLDLKVSSSDSKTVTLAPGQVLKFRVDITVPKDVEPNNWSCIEVSATPSSCDTEAIKTILSVYVPNPSEG